MRLMPSMAWSIIYSKVSRLQAAKRNLLVFLNGDSIAKELKFAKLEAACGGTSPCRGGFSCRENWSAVFLRADTAARPCTVARPCTAARHAQRFLRVFFLKNFRLSICNPRKGQYSKARAAPVLRKSAGVLWKQNSAIRRAGICISVVAVHISQQQVKPRPV